ncbi:MAG: oligoendopeptidase F [Clostridia bacterium]|nr:oligoendopeptidase F [Clostridia bacterium]
MEVKERKDIPEEFTWDFTPIYKDDAEWEAAYAKAEKLVSSLPSLAGGLCRSSASLKKGLDAFMAASENVERVYLYSMLKKNTDNGDTAYQTMSGRAENLYVRFATASSFVTPEILAADEKKFAGFLADPTLAGYRHMLDDIGRGRTHTKDAETEKILAMMRDPASAVSNAFDMFEAVDVDFPTINAGGEKVKLSNGIFGVLRESPDREVRRRAFAGLFGEFYKFRNTIAALYTGNVKNDNFIAKVRNHASACEMALFADNAGIEVYDSLVEAIHGGLPTMYRYLDLRRRALGLKKLHMYDLYCPIVKDVDMSFTFDEAKKTVKNALKPLGKEYGKLLDRAFGERWIDVYENKGKTTGAYSCGVYGAHPYVLLNFTGTLDDVFTLAHELGHCMHSYFSSRDNDYANHDYAIMVAEVASTVNEVLLTRYLLATEKDPGRRAYVLNHFLEGFRTTVFRQTLFAEFERRAHDLDAAGVPLTAEQLSSVFRRLNLLYYRGVTVDPIQDIEWARIPHFYNAFYVYKYATGFCSAVTIAGKILDEGGAANYLKFLSTGGSDYPIEELKIAGVDLSRPDAVASALKEFDRCVTELDALIGAAE